MIDNLKIIETYIFSHSFQDKSFQLCKTAVDSCSSSFFHDWLVAL